MIREIIERTRKGSGQIVYDKDPKVLVEKVIKLVEEGKEKDTH